MEDSVGNVRESALELLRRQGKASLGLPTVGFDITRIPKMAPEDQQQLQALAHSLHCQKPVEVNSKTHSRYLIQFDPQCQKVERQDHKIICPSPQDLRTNREHKSQLLQVLKEIHLI